VSGTALVERLRREARVLGLGPIGIAPIAPSDHADALRRWLDRGFAAGMTWMHRTALDSVDPGRRFAWARSAIVAAQPYLPYAGNRRAQPGLLPHVARYAAGGDYHATLATRLEALAARLAEQAPGMQHRVYVDTGPLLERELAARAGLGWFGKHANLILRDGNSWVLLGEILTSVSLPADEPIADRCGSCTACIDACPTGAIVEPYVVDSNRCISYLTIEHRGPLPEGAPDAGDWLFGCDVCQEVCPWNRDVPPVSDPDFLPGEAIAGTSLDQAAAMDEEAFKRRFGATALMRARRPGVVRNALHLGRHLGDPATLAVAGSLREDPDPGVRAAAERTRRPAAEARPAPRRDDGRTS
jgi:epoxyqueuosine reductase